MKVDKGYKMKVDVTTLDAALNRMVSLTREDYGSYAFAAGVLHQQLAAAFADMPAHQQRTVLKVINDIADRSEEKLNLLEQEKQFAAMNDMENV